MQGDEGISHIGEGCEGTRRGLPALGWPAGRCAVWAAVALCHRRFAAVSV